MLYISQKLHFEMSVEKFWPLMHKFSSGKRKRPFCSTFFRFEHWQRTSLSGLSQHGLDKMCDVFQCGHGSDEGWRGQGPQRWHENWKATEETVAYSAFQPRCMQQLPANDHQIKRAGCLKLKSLQTLFSIKNWAKHVQFNHSAPMNGHAKVANWLFPWTLHSSSWCFSSRTFHVQNWAVSDFFFEKVFIFAQVLRLQQYFNKNLIICAFTFKI